MNKHESKVVEVARNYVAAMRDVIHAAAEENDARSKSRNAILRLRAIEERARAEMCVAALEASLVEAVEELEDALEAGR